MRIGIEAPRDIRVVRGELPMKATADSTAEAADEAGQEPDEENGSPAAATSVGSQTRLPQRRKFDRGSQAPLKQLMPSAVALAK